MATNREVLQNALHKELEFALGPIETRGIVLAVQAMIDHAFEAWSNDRCTEVLSDEYLTSIVGNTAAMQGVSPTPTASAIERMQSHAVQAVAAVENLLQDASRNPDGCLNMDFPLPKPSPTVAEIVERASKERK